MTNGWLIAAAADAEIGATLAAGFELELMLPAPDQGRGGQVMQLAEAANVGIVLSGAAHQDPDFVALLKALVSHRGGAQLLLAEPDIRNAFPFLPQSWPTLPLDEALRRANLAAERRGAPHAAPLPPAPAPQQEQQQQEQAQHQEAQQQGHDEQTRQRADESDGHAAEPAEPVERAITLDETDGATAPEEARDESGELFGGAEEAPGYSGGAPAPPPPDDLADDAPEAEAEPQPTLEQEPPPAPEPPPTEAEAPQSAAPPPMAAAPPPRAAPAPASAGRAEPPPHDPPTPQTKRAELRERTGVTLAADATAFAPRKLRRSEAELVRIIIHQPKDLAEVIRAARKADPRTTPAPQSMSVGDVSIGARIGVALEVRGGASGYGALQRRTWLGDPLDFAFAVEADADVKQVVILARVFVEDAQIGVIGFTRQVMGPRPKPLPDGDRARLKRHKRVFLSYSSRDRETVSAIATAYQSAGVEHFWDRASLKSGEEWSPRLRREIERCDLFHLCWSQSAAASEWVEKEATHALGLRRKKKKPDITVQMLDGPPWAKHPDSLDSINFDDFVRAAIVGYTRGAAD